MTLSDICSYQQRCTFFLMGIAMRTNSGTCFSPVICHPGTAKEFGDILQTWCQPAFRPSNDGRTVRGFMAKTETSDNILSLDGGGSERQKR